MVADAEKFKEQDKHQAERIKAKQQLENYIFSLRNRCSDEKVAGKMSEEDKQRVLKLVEEVQKWLDSNESAEKDELEAKQKEVSQSCGVCVIGCLLLID